MGMEINKKSPDVLCLQEIQSNIYVPTLARILTNAPYQAFRKNKRKPVGGLVTASKYPYIKQAFHPFPNRGRKWSIGYADWALLKGVLATYLEVDGLSVVILNTHLQANYLAAWTPDHNQGRTHWLARIQRDQIDFLAAFVREQDENAMVVVCGDFNFPPHVFLYSDLIQKSGLIDPLAVDPRSTYHPFPLVSSNWATRLDYALYRAPKDVILEATVDIIELKNKAARFFINRFLTDHYLLKLELHWV